VNYEIDWTEWSKYKDWWPQNQPWAVCPNCGQSYQGWTHVCSNITPYNPTITIGGYNWPVETKMDKSKVIRNLAKIQALIDLVIEDKLEIGDVYSDIEDLIKNSTNEVIGD
jgi:hypothetical protein